MTSETSLDGFFMSGLNIMQLFGGGAGGVYGKLILCLLLQVDKVPKPLDTVGETQPLPKSPAYFIFVYSLPLCRDF